MESQDKAVQQSQGAKFLKYLRILFIAGIALVLILVLIFLAPLPFIHTMWNTNIGQRWRMSGAVSCQITGLSQDEVQEILGPPQHVGGSIGGRLAISYPSPRPGQEWLHIIIFFNEDGVAQSVSSGNPAHFGLGG